MGWKLKVSEYGKIESAEIETAPLTLFVGDNNSGKSYLVSLLWGIRHLGLELLFVGENECTTEAEDRLLHWVKEQVRKVMESGKNTVQASEIGNELQTVLKERVDRNKDRFMKAIFNSADVGIEKLEIDLTELEKALLSFEVEMVGGRTVIFTRMAGRGVGLILAESEQISGEPKDSFCRRMIMEIFDLLINEGDGIYRRANNSIYLPAARTGFMLTKDIINKAGREAAFNMGMDEEAFIPFVRPINQFLDVINDLALDGKGSADFAEVIRYLEGGMADGAVEMNALPNREVRYVPKGKTAGMPLRTVSAVVTELSPLILILKHKKRVDFLFYEEPEMCLHPQLQQKMARVLCQLANAGVQMNVTTHSDIILQHINNMIRLSGREDREEICRQLGYSAADLLHPDQVKVYQLTAEAGAKTKVEELSCGENGFAVPTFNDALDRIMDEAYVIQE